MHKTFHQFRGNLLDIGGGGGGDIEGGGAGGGKGGRGCGGGDVECGGAGGGDGGKGGGGGEGELKVTSRPFSLSAPLRTSCTASFLSADGGGGTAGFPVGDLLGEEVLLLFARTAAFLLAREAVRAALARLVGSGLALSTWARANAYPACVGVHNDSVLSGRGDPVEGDASGGKGEDLVAVPGASPIVGVAGDRRPPSASLLLSSRLLLLLARSLLLLPLCCV